MDLQKAKENIKLALHLLDREERPGAEELLNEALAELIAIEAEKPGEDTELRSLVNRIDSICNLPTYKPKTDSRVNDSMNLVMEFVKSYHATQCATCDKLRKKLAFSAYHQQHDSDVELTAERE